MEDKIVKILAIDDNNDNLISLNALIKEAFPEAQFFTAPNGRQGIEIAAREYPDVILLDIIMPDFDGFEVCRLLKADQKLRYIPIVFVTALKGDMESRIRALECGAEAFLAKPIDEIELTAQIRAMVKIKSFNIEKISETARLAKLVEEKIRLLSQTNTATLNLLEDLRNENEARKNSEKALSEKEEEYRSMFANNPQPMWIYDLETLTFLEVNDAALHHYGYTRDEFLSMTIKDIRPKEDIDHLLKDDETTNHTYSSADEWRHLKKTGEIITVEIVSHSLTFNERKARHVMVTDITERKQTAEALQLSEEKYRTIFENIQDVFYQTDLEGFVLEISPSIKHFSEFSRNEIIGLPISTLYFNPDDKDVFLKTIEVKGELHDYELKLKTKSGNMKYVSINARLILDSNGKPHHIDGAIRDITERKRAELQIQASNEQIEIQNKELQGLIEELNRTNADLITAKEKAEESDKLKTAFLHNISHEIRTPMNAIIGFTEFLTEPNLSIEKTKYFTKIIVNSSYQLLSIISDIISIATIEAGQEKINEKECNINATLKSLHEQFLLKVDETNVCLILKHLLPDNDVYIKTDETKLIQILTNLINNAIKFTNRGYINIGYKIQDNQLEFLVEDTGIGIPSEMHKEIFNRFSQVESTTARQYGGSGLGLSISKAYIELLGGKIWVKSELGKGSAFHFTIPFKPVEKKTIIEQPCNSKSKANGNGVKNFLVAEDEDSNFMLIKEFLSGFNANIIHAVNGIAAVNICKSDQPIDLVLMDIKMPLMDGYEAAKQIKEVRPNLPIIAQTAYSTEADKNKALACGCSDFISKPIKKSALLAKIKEQLSKT